MSYVKVRWHHDGGDDPIILYHEIASDRREIRRVELFEDGRLQSSDRVDPEAATSLSLEPLPTLEEIRSQPEFDVVEIDQSAFEDVWTRAGGGRG